MSLVLVMLLKGVWQHDLFVCDWFVCKYGRGRCSTSRSLRGIAREYMADRISRSPLHAHVNSDLALAVSFVTFTLHVSRDQISNFGFSSNVAQVTEITDERVNRKKAHGFRYFQIGFMRCGNKSDTYICFCHVTKPMFPCHCKSYIIELVTQWTTTMPQKMAVMQVRCQLP